MSVWIISFFHENSFDNFVQTMSRTLKQTKLYIPKKRDYHKYYLLFME